LEVLELSNILFLAAAGFFAAFIDSTVGGGGLISVPALLFMGLPPSMALGTNKLAASMGGLSSFLSFLHAKKIKKDVLFFMPLSFIGSAVGALLAARLPQEYMNYIVAFLLIAIVVYSYLRKDWGQRRGDRLGRPLNMSAVRIIFALSAVVIGFYDGFFGPGTGSFLIFVFLFLGQDFVHAAGNAKALNFASGIGGLFSFALSNAVLWKYGLIMGAAMIIGAFVGSNLAIKKGASYIKPLFLIVSSLMIAKLLFDIFK
jgi:uncharacterized membrane protein YfcA